MLRRIRFGCLIASLAVSACVIDSSPDTDDDEPIAQSSYTLTKTDPVSAAVTASCSTNSVRGLAIQLVEEIQCLRPNTFKRIDNIKGIKLGSAVFPYLQTPVADALAAAQKARGVTLSLNSGLRALPQQYLLYRWYKAGRCGISLAASPGKSNHESALAIDVQDNAAWRSALQSKGFRWLGANDPVHFDYKGGGTVDLRGLSVLAFQRLWNRNNPNDKIDEDGIYGPQTEKRLAKAPVGGFKIGAKCDEPKKSMDEEKPLPLEVPVTPDGDAPGDGIGELDTEPDMHEDGTHEHEHVDDDDADDVNDDTSKGVRSLPRPTVDSAGCAMGTSKPGAFGIAAGLVALGALVTRRRREDAPSR